MVDTIDEIIENYNVSDNCTGICYFDTIALLQLPVGRIMEIIDSRGP
jgi:hypothetical protein